MDVVVPGLKREYLIRESCISRHRGVLGGSAHDPGVPSTLVEFGNSSATTTVVVANGDPPFRKVMGLAVRSKVVCHCCGADRFTTEAPLSNIAG
ncbi:hypothetical protein KSP40_PGU008948 [Platanthera guangdongensis]|uniref:Uncharacterized protein n=1 Tax=Platanthera guangdongensis TaxID=2320717 RepID=A0ABR2LY34_9ASPA